MADRYSMMKIKQLEEKNRELEKQVSYYEGYIDCMKDVFMDDILPISTVTLDGNGIETKIMKRDFKKRREEK